MITSQVKFCLLALISFTTASPVLKANFKAIDSPTDELHIKASIPSYNFEDVLLLKPYYLNEQEKLAKVTDCKFIGNLASNPKASVALTGCLGAGDVTVTILSKMPTLAKTFVLKTNGDITEEDTMPDFTAAVRNQDDPDSDDFDEAENDPDDEVFEDDRADDFDSEACFNGGGAIEDEMPQDLTMTVTLGYDDHFLTAYSIHGGQEEAVATIKYVATHAQAYWYAETLGTRITQVVVGDVTYHEGTHLIGKAKPNTLPDFKTVLEEATPAIPAADVHVIFVAHAYLWKHGLEEPGLIPPDKPIGVATGGNVCTGDIYNCMSIVERGGGTTGNGMIKTYLHEIGHNLGMRHNKNFYNFDGSGSFCKASKPQIQIMRQDNGWFIDSWPTGKDFIWTICNRCDLLRNYKEKIANMGSYCLDKTNP